MLTQRHFWLRDAHKHPVACVASTPTDANTQVKFALAIANPRDPFSRSRGRTIAYARLASPTSPFCFHVPLLHRHTKQNILCRIASTPILPLRIRLAATSMLKSMEDRLISPLEAVAAELRARMTQHYAPQHLAESVNSFVSHESHTPPEPPTVPDHGDDISSALTNIAEAPEYSEQSELDRLLAPSTEEPHEEWNP